MECFPPKIRNRTKISTLKTSLNIILEILDSAIRPEKEIKSTQIGKEKVKQPLVTVNPIFYVEKSNGIYKKATRISLAKSKDTRGI